MERLPPKEKIYEAYTAMADGRVALAPGSTREEGEATVCSSTGEKAYTVAWKGNVYAANDSATYWQGYAGYPVLAVLMATGRLPFEERALPLLKGIPWNDLNKAAGRDYAAAFARATQTLGKEQQNWLSLMADRAMEALRALDIETKRKGRPAK